MLSSVLLQITTPAATVADTLNKAAATVTPAIPETTPNPKTFFDLIEWTGPGGIVLILIAFMSIITLYFFFERFFVIKKATKTDPLFMHNIKDFIHNGNMEAAKAMCKATPTPLARMVEKGITRLGKPIKEIEEAMESVGKLEVFKLEKNLNILSINGRVAPILGFIGTIMGVIIIFYDIGNSGDIAIKSISEGLYVKMISSAAGLIVGLLAFLAYYVINTMLDKAINKMETGAVEFIDMLQEPTK